MQLGAALELRQNRIDSFARAHRYLDNRFVPSLFIELDSAALFANCVDNTISVGFPILGVGQRRCQHHATR